MIAYVRRFPHFNLHCSNPSSKTYWTVIKNRAFQSRTQKTEWSHNLRIGNLTSSHHKSHLAAFVLRQSQLIQINHWNFLWLVTGDIVFPIYEIILIGHAIWCRNSHPPAALKANERGFYTRFGTLIKVNSYSRSWRMAKCELYIHT